MEHFIPLRAEYSSDPYEQDGPEQSPRIGIQGELAERKCDDSREISGKVTDPWDEISDEYQGVPVFFEPVSGGIQLFGRQKKPLPILVDKRKPSLSPDPVRNRNSDRRS